MFYKQRPFWKTGWEISNFSQLLLTLGSGISVPARLLIFRHFPRGHAPYLDQKLQFLLKKYIFGWNKNHMLFFNIKCQFSREKHSFFCQIFQEDYLFQGARLFQTLEYTRLLNTRTTNSIQIFVISKGCKFEFAAAATWGHFEPRLNTLKVLQKP